MPGHSKTVWIAQILKTTGSSSMSMETSLPLAPTPSTSSSTSSSFSVAASFLLCTMGEHSRFCVFFGENNDATFSPFSGIYSPSSCWESCSVDSQWNSDDFCFFYFLDWTSESWEKWILVRLQSDDGDADHRRVTLQNRDPSDRKLFSLMIERLSFEPDGSNNTADS